MVVRCSIWWELWLIFQLGDLDQIPLLELALSGQYLNHPLLTPFKLLLPLAAHTISVELCLDSGEITKNQWFNLPMLPPAPTATTDCLDYSCRNQAGMVCFLIPKGKARSGSGKMQTTEKFRKVETQIDFSGEEHSILQFWDSNKIFEQLKIKNTGKPSWSFLDGPITANNPMGVHHAWGSTYKDAYNAISP